MKIKCYVVTTPRGKHVAYGRLAIEAIRCAVEDAHSNLWEVPWNETRNEWRKLKRKGFKCVRISGVLTHTSK